MHAWQSAVNTVNLTTSGKSPVEKEAIITEAVMKEAAITSSDSEKVTVVSSMFLFVLHRG